MVVGRPDKILSGRTATTFKLKTHSIYKNKKKVRLARLTFIKRSLFMGLCLAIERITIC